MRICEGQALIGFERLKRPVVIHDSGFSMRTWDYFPGAYVKHALETIGIDGLLLLDRERPGACELQECTMYFDQMNTVFCLGYVVGSLSNEPRGESLNATWGDLARIFIPDDQPGRRRETIAEMSEGRHARWRLRRKGTSMSLFARWYNDFLEEKSHGNTSRITTKHSSIGGR